MTRSNFSASLRLCGAILCLSFALYADQPLPPELQGVGVDEHLGQPIDLNLTFTAENGYPVALKDFFHKDRPVILNLVYYSCPMLCNMILNGQTAALKEVPWTPGNEFEIVTISIDPTETFNLAQQKRAVYLESYGRATSGWHFLTDDHGNVKKLADQVGFHYRYDEKQAQYAHAAVITVLTPQGKVSRYLYGIKFNPRDIRLALTEASESKFGLSVERVLLYCFHYDPKARGYVLFASNLMRAGGALTVLVLALILSRLWRRERRGAPREVLAQ
jgi:protein SCO1/2